MQSPPGEVAKEEVHGSVEMRVQQDQRDHPRFLNQSEEVDSEHQKEWHLQLWVTSYPGKSEELSHDLCCSPWELFINYENAMYE